MTLEDQQRQERERLDVIRRLRLLNTSGEEIFDRVAELAAEIFDTPIGLMTVVGEDHQWHKAATGIKTKEVRRKHSFCAHAIEESAPTTIEDLAEDGRFDDNPHVGCAEDASNDDEGDDSGGFQFYGGAPYAVEGKRLGTICVLDYRPRSPSAKAVRQLNHLSELVEEELRTLLAENERSDDETAGRNRSDQNSDSEHGDQAGATPPKEQDLGDGRLVSEGEDRYRTALKHSPVVFAKVDTDLRYEWICNPHDDFRPETVYGKRDDELDSGPGIEALVDLKRRTLNQCKQQRAQITFERSDGPRTYDITATPIREDPGGAVTGLTTAALDVTRQRKTESRLQQTREWLAASAKAAGAALFVVAPDYSATHYVNDTAEELYGVPRSELVSTPTAWMRHIHPSDRSALEQSVEEQRRGDVQGSVHQEFRIQHPDKGLRWMQVQLHPINGPDGEIRQLAGIGMDVTTEKRRGEELRRQNDLFRRAQKIAKVGGWEFRIGDHSLKSERYTVTEQTLAIHGLPPEADLPPEKSLSFYHPEDRPAIREAFRRAVEEQKPYDLELRLEDANGNERWIRTRGEPQVENGDVVRVRGTLQDITERKQQEQELRVAEERFRTVVENARPVVFMTDEEGTFLLSEGHDLEALDLRPGEVVGQSLFDVYADHPTINEDIRRALEGENISNEVEVDGRVFDGWYSPFYDEEGAVAGCIGMAADVTKRRQMEEDLREREGRLRFAQEVAHLGYWRRDLRSEELDWSGETRRIFGWPSDKEVTYEAFMAAVVPDDRQQLKAAQEAALAGEAPLEIEYRIRRPSGEERVVYERGGLRKDEDGEPIALMGAVLDVTKAVRRRKKLRHAKEKAEQVDRIKTALLSNMNHELRTPLTSILTFSKLIDQNPGAADQFTGRILGGARRLLYTLNTVMEFAELEGEVHHTQYPEMNERCQLEGTVRAVLSDYRNQAQEKGVEMEMHIAKSETVYFDSHLLERILTHLVDNSVKFTEEGQICVTATASEDVLELQVDDTGVGIDPEFLPQACNEFAQSSTGLARRYEGNGLGLTVTKRLIERVGGALNIESEPGEGTWVTVRLPTRSPAAVNEKR